VHGRNLLHAPERLHDENLRRLQRHNSMIYPATREEAEARHTAFIRRWRPILSITRLADSLQEAGRRSPSADLFWALPASDQINMRKLDVWQTPASKHRSSPRGLTRALTSPPDQVASVAEDHAAQIPTAAVPEVLGCCFWRKRCPNASLAYQSRPQPLTSFLSAAKSGRIAPRISKNYLGEQPSRESRSGPIPTEGNAE
jgi:hypothetical protein